MPAGPEPDRATVLVVDDTAENIDVLFGILKEHYKVRAARNGEKALKIAKRLKRNHLRRKVIKYCNG
mgnify:CR=1 FL=1